MTETIDATRVGLVLVGKGTRSSVRAETRELRPRTNGVVQFRYRGRLGGWVTARLRLALEPGRPALFRTFRVKL